MSFLDLYQGDQAQAATIQPNEGHDLPSTFSENFNAAWGDGLLFSQSVARDNARASVLSDYVSEIKQKTGQDLSQDLNPDAESGTIGPSMFDQANARVAKLKADFPDLDLNPLSEDEINQRALDKAQTAHRNYEALQAGERTSGGAAASFLGSAASSAADPINLLALAVAPETGGASILGAALRWGGLAAVSQAAIEASSDGFKEQVAPGYMESGQPIKEIAGAFFGGAVLGGSLKGLGNAWTRVKTGAWPTSVRDAGNVIESEANVASTNPFPGAEGEAVHRDALVKTIDDILAGRPVQIDHIVTPDFLERSRSLVSRLEGKQPMSLPIINQRAIELIADQDRLSRRDADLAAHLETLPPGDQAAAETLSRVQAVEGQIENATTADERRALSRRRDELLADTTPEQLQAAAAPIEQRRVAEAERASIADQLSDIAEEHAKMQADHSLLSPMQLPALGQRERIPTGPKGQFELDLQPPAEEPVVAPAIAGPQPLLQTPEEMNKTLAAPDHQDAIRADIDRERAMGDLKVPGIDENGNHTMVGVDAAMNEVDAYKQIAEQIQACASPMQESAE